ncbi:transposase [Pediococcus acidilactici]|uniref:transposase n=1 Tax=Pediococcus acidilactici TaxID=1254 RepID=UPI003CF20803
MLQLLRTRPLLHIFVHYLILLKHALNHRISLYSPLLNGRIEGTIRKIKQIQRTAYGYRNWQHLRDRIYIEFIFKLKKKTNS